MSTNYPIFIDSESNKSEDSQLFGYCLSDNYDFYFGNSGWRKRANNT